MTELVPELPVPVVRTPDLRSLLAHYRDVLGFELLQHVPAVVALLRHGPVRLQLWQRAGARPACCRIALDGTDGGVFALHARLWRLGATASAAPRLQPWGAWEFGLGDCAGNGLVFFQWATTVPEGAPPGTAAGWLRQRS